MCEACTRLVTTVVSTMNRDRGSTRRGCRRSEQSLEEMRNRAARAGFLRGERRDLNPRPPRPQLETGCAAGADERMLMRFPFAQVS
jgi:hypothetical protein